ncbi:DUF6547 family protein [Mesorhizobium carmichaelinearum]|uniref:DUF6547 family protein n=1 Tax=Mesorhizobium carmichaelinearum TaxID=1208188 RepID=UPI00117DFCF9|nr:DUF6547 family protein [Mesorhizobium carmichaelinearum]
MNSYSEGGLRYQKLIDEFVELASSEAIAGRIRKDGHSERTNDADLPLDLQEKARKAFLLSLSESNREIVAQLIEEARNRAVHDILSSIEWMHTCGGLDLIVEGHPLPKDPFWGSMHMDYVCRRAGESWPEEESETE